MTEKELRQKVCDTARSFLGCRESDGSFEKIVDIYNSISPLPRGYRAQYSDPWCAIFVSAVGKECGLEKVIYPECSCDYMRWKYRENGQFEPRGGRVQSGDLIIYDYDGNDSSDHVGLIVDVSDGIIRLIEGNSGDMVAQRQIFAESPYIHGICHPDYASAADGKSETEESGELETEPESFTVELKPLRQGSIGEDVRSMQALLALRGYRCGWYGADGEFGPATNGALLRYQRGRCLTADGVCGAETWDALLKGR